MIIWYLGHSSWAVKSDKYILVFDYGREPVREDRGSFDTGVVDLSTLKDEKNILFLASHKHSDHYSKYINKLSQNYSNMKFILGDIKSSYKNSIRLKPHQKFTVDNIDIYTSASTDEGVSFLLDDGIKTIYHGGDNAIWEDTEEFKIKYKAEIDYIASIKTNIDIAFIPICSFSETIKPSMLEGAIYALNKLQPKNIFPMHGSSYEYLYEQFKTSLPNYNILNASYNGQKFIL